MPDPTPIQRLIVCVDGGRSSHGAFGHSNTTNISKIVSLVKEGRCTTSNGTLIEQTVIYAEAVDESPNLLTSYKSKDIEGQIEFTTKAITNLIRSPQDEIYFYGSGHGAYIVRAIAGVLHHMGLPKPWSMVRFHENYLNALELYKARLEEDNARAARLDKSLRAQCHEPPQIKFIGVFDTVKENTDTTLHDMSFNSSTHVFRHAVALNEGNSDMVGISDPAPGEEPGRSAVQAWFMGNNEDLCGGVQHDGLSMYPLQWMILESLQAGLVLRPPPPADGEENALILTFPQYVGALPVLNSGEDVEWRSKYANGLRVSMYDLQPTHASNRTRGSGSHTVHSKSGGSSYNATRKVFSLKKLIGYSKTGPSSTIVHPSVYCLLDRYPRLQENQRMKSLKKDLAEFQERYMESADNALPPWLEGMQLQANGVKAFRILVCGKTGVGKSTLINKVFGVEITEESNTYAQGAHDINQAFESPSHPGLLVHDSRGWQAGSNQELELIAKFLRKRAFQKDPAEALHVIWFCVDSDVARIEEADRKTFEIITQYSHHVPVFIIGTKKDKIANFRKMQLLEQYLESDTMVDVKKTNQLINLETEKHVKKQFSELITQFSKIKHYRSDGQLCLSKGDDDGIKELLNQTLGLIADDRVRLFCVAAQVVSVDQKISSAVTESMRLGAHAIRTAMIPLPCSGIIGTPTVSRMLCEQILQCFGFPKAAPEAVEEIMSRVVMDNLKQYMAVAMTQFLVVSGATAGVAVATLGIGSVLGVAGCIFAAPPAARMLLKCACDMILILERAFRYGGKFVSVKQIEDAARYYAKSKVKTSEGKEQLLQKRVHGEVEKMIPLTSVKTAWKFSKLRVGLEEIIYNNRYSGPVEVTRPRSRSPSVSESRAESSHSQSRNKKVSISGLAELSTESQIHELAGHEVAVEIGARASIAELEGDLAELPNKLRNSRLSKGVPTSPVSKASKSTGSSWAHSTNPSSVESTPVSPERNPGPDDDRPPPYRINSDSSKPSRQVPTSRFSNRFSLRKSKTTS